MKENPTQLAGGLLLKKLECFKVMLNIFDWSMQISLFELPNHISRLT